MAVAIAAECDFCPNTLEVDTAAGLNSVDVRAIAGDPSLLEPGWLKLALAGHELITFCPRCAIAFRQVADAIEAGIDQVLEGRRKAIA